MRPETLKRLVDNAISQYLGGGGHEKLNRLLPRMKRLWLKYAKEEGDFRGGEEVYGDDDPAMTMTYISDRWRCAVRLKWIIDGVESGAIGKIKQDNNHE